MKLSVNLLERELSHTHTWLSFVVHVAQTHFVTAKSPRRRRGSDQRGRLFPQARFFLVQFPLNKWQLLSKIDGKTPLACGFIIISPVLEVTFMKVRGTHGKK